MATPKELVETYGNAFLKKDFDTVRRCLHDTRFTFKGPMEAFDNADEFVAVLRKLGPITKGMEEKKVFADGNDVCVIYDFVTNVPEIGATRMAEWFHIEDGRIASINIYFDPRPYVAVFEQMMKQH
jgi:limonene-1,2-epoxide hydrolase